VAVSLPHGIRPAPLGNRSNSGDPAPRECATRPSASSISRSPARSPLPRSLNVRGSYFYLQCLAARISGNSWAGQRPRRKQRRRWSFRWIGRIQTRGTKNNRRFGKSIDAFVPRPHRCRSCSTHVLSTYAAERSSARRRCDSRASFPTYIALLVWRTISRQARGQGLEGGLANRPRTIDPAMPTVSDTSRRAQSRGEPLR